MYDNFINMVCEMVGNDKPRKCSLPDVVNEFVLPKILKPYQKRENQCISDAFMKLMANYGHYLYKNGYDYLLELAMQRISRGAVIHKRIPEKECLPIKVQDYAAIYDRPTPMSSECFMFLLAQASFIMNKTNDELKKHMTLILFGILNNLTEDGKELYANTLDKEVWPPSLYMVAWNTIRETLPFSEIVDELATPKGIVKYNLFFRAKWDDLDKKSLIKKLNITGLLKKHKLKKMIFYDTPIYMSSISL